jgi:hypothetical protein
MFNYVLARVHSWEDGKSEVRNLPLNNGSFGLFSGIMAGKIYGIIFSIKRFFGHHVCNMVVTSRAMHPCRNVHCCSFGGKQQRVPAFREIRNQSQHAQDAILE